MRKLDVGYIVFYQDSQDFGIVTHRRIDESSFNGWWWIFWFDTMESAAINGNYRHIDFYDREGKPVQEE